MHAEHSLVVLKCNIPESGLYGGDVGAVVHVYRSGVAYEVEFVDGDGTPSRCSRSNLNPFVQSEAANSFTRAAVIWRIKTMNASGGSPLCRAMQVGTSNPGKYRNGDHRLNTSPANG